MGSRTPRKGYGFKNPKKRLWVQEPQQKGMGSRTPTKGKTMD
jgi:hypothetical protein